MEINHAGDSLRKTYEAMINDIFWEGNSIGVCLPLPVITEINEVIGEMRAEQQLVLKMCYGLDGEGALACATIARTIGSSSASVELSLATARSSLAYKLTQERGFDHRVFEMSREELIAKYIEMQHKQRALRLENRNLRNQLDAEKKLNEHLKHEETIESIGEPYNIPLSEIGLKNHTLDVLVRCKMTHINDVVQRRECDLLRLYRFGQASLDDLKRCLKPYGLTILR